jgi:hypothetical protein
MAMMIISFPSLENLAKRFRRTAAMQSHEHCDPQTVLVSMRALI